MTKRHVVHCARSTALAVASAVAQQNPYLGRWNITPSDKDATYVYWLEVKQDGGKLSGMLLNRGGHPLPVPVIKIENGELIFQPDGGTRGPGPEFHMRAQGDKMTGSVKLADGTVNLVGARPPKWGSTTRMRRTSPASRWSCSMASRWTRGMSRTRAAQ